jgi:hypothetical protein
MALATFAPAVFPLNSDTLKHAITLFEQQGMLLDKLDSPACSLWLWEMVMKEVEMEWQKDRRGLTRMDLLFLKEFGRSRHPEWPAPRLT